MKDLKLYWVDAFTDQPFRGNPAGIVVNADNL
ncbi:MAG: PhzF family phenazine biosynthesis protein [Dysgonomonas sp.]